MSKQKRFDEHIGIRSSEAKYRSISTCKHEKPNSLWDYHIIKEGEEIEIPKPIYIYMKKN
jgi:hypothetical protein